MPRADTFLESAARDLAASFDPAGDAAWHDYVGHVQAVLAAVEPSLKNGRAVKIPGVGTLRPKKRRKWLARPTNLKRGVAREDTIVQLQHPAVLEQGEPYEAL